VFNEIEKEFLNKLFNDDELIIIKIKINKITEIPLKFLA
jgi:hypothetical protein